MRKRSHCRFRAGTSKLSPGKEQGLANIRAACYKTSNRGISRPNTQGSSRYTKLHRDPQHHTCAQNQATPTRVAFCMPHYKPCAHPGCHTLIPHTQRRCTAHPLAPRGYAHAKARAQVLAGATHCTTCEQPFTTANPATLGHRVPRAHGGTLAPSNLMPQCRRCNLEQGVRTVLT